MKRFLVASMAVLVCVGIFFAGWFAKSILTKVDTKDLPAPLAEKLRPLEKYTIENLTEAEIKPAKLSVDISENSFAMDFEPGLDGNIKKVTGRVTFPLDGKSNPVVVMIRGFVNQEIYESGMGTQRAADYFSENGFITIAPDFLGYAGSSSETENIFETRFQTYTTILSLLKSLDQIPGWDGKNVFIWGHSNGGQIALTVLEITGADYPTTLWAPVSKPFPYSVLYYTDESQDRGKLIRSELSEFEEDYDVEKYSLTNYFDKIVAPLQIHQGTDDDAVPVGWTGTLVKSLEDLEKEVKYHKYPGADHNLRPSWDTVVARDASFFNQHKTQR